MKERCQHVTVDSIKIGDRWWSASGEVFANVTDGRHSDAQPPSSLVAFDPGDVENERAEIEMATSVDADGDDYRECVTSKLDKGVRSRLEQAMIGACEWPA